jgi:Glyoxalase-like domain
MSTKRAPRGGERGRPGREGAVSDSIKLSSVTLDCPDAGKLAAFYAEITGGEVTFLNEAWATVDGPGGRIDFQTAPGHVPLDLARPDIVDADASGLLRR